MLTFDFGGCSNQELVYGKEFDRELFEETERVGCLRRSHAPLDDIEKFAPIDPIQNRAAMSFVLVVKSRLYDLPTGFAVKETDEGKAIENDLFAHGAPLPCVLGEDLELRKTGPSKSPWPPEWDQEAPA